jgi:hypothetical protein
MRVGTKSPSSPLPSCFFPFEKRVEVLRQVFYDTGKQPSQMEKVELDKLLKPYKPSWFQVAVVNPSITAAAIIIVAILYISSHS